MARVPTSQQRSAKTDVDPADTRREIEKILVKYHASNFGFHEDWEEGYGALQFKIDKQSYRLTIRYPKITDDEIKYDTLGRWIAESRRKPRRDQVIRQRWRQIKNYIHAVLDTKESGAITLEQALFAFLVIPDGRTMEEFMQDSAEEIARTGAPPALPAPRERIS